MSAQPVVVELEGHLTPEALERSLAPASISLRAAPAPLVVDCAKMTGYDPEARSAFVAWNRDHRERVSRVAVVTDKAMWSLVISAMSLASSQTMKPFPTRDEAMAWAQTS